MKAEFELTADDLVALTTVHASRSPTLRRQRWSALLICCTVLLLLPGLVLVTTDKPVLEAAKAIWPLLMGPILFLVIVVPYWRWKTARLTKRICSEAGPSGFGGLCSLAIEADGLVETRTSGVTTLQWSGVQKVLVTGTHAFIYTSSIEAFVLPRRAFGSTHDFDRFVEQVSQRAGVESQDV